MFRFNSTSNEIEYYNGALWTNPSTVFTLITDQQFTGDGATTNFTLSSASTTNATIVTINGVVQIPGLAYAVAGTTLALVEAPLTTDVVDVRVLVTTQTLSGVSSPNGFNMIAPDDTGVYIWNGTSSTTNTWKFDSSTGNLLPIGTRDIGSPTAIVDNIYVSNVVISGGSISGVSFTLAAIDSTPVGAVTPATGAFTTLSTNSALNLTAGAAVTYNQTGTSVGTSAVTVDSFAAATYRTAKYVVSVTNGSSYQAAEVLVVQDGVNAYITTYAIVSSTGTPFVTFTANVVGSNVVLQATGTASGNVVKVQKTYIAV
jgi:hypothetical protein